MLALVLDGELRLDYQYPKPVFDGENAVVRVLKAGVCKTDIELINGYKGFQGIIGHEFVGLVEQHPDPYWHDKRIVGEINIWCGACDSCQRGNVTHCLNRKVLGMNNHDGAFAEYLTLPVVNLHLVPTQLSNEVAVFTEPVAAALQILEQVHIRPQDEVVVLGDGKLGLLCAQVLALSCGQVTMVGRHDYKLQLAKQWGITTVKNTSGQEFVLKHKVDLVVDCTGSATGLPQALNLVRPGGSVVLKSTYHALTEVAMTSVVVNEIRIIGSRCGPFSAALKMLACEKIKVQSLIDRSYSLQQGINALQYANDKGTLKVLIDVTNLEL